MSKYKEVTQVKAEIFLKLYKKYLALKYKVIEDCLITLPTNVIERCFEGYTLFEEGFDASNLDDAEFGFNGLCGWMRIENLSKELEFCKEHDLHGTLDSALERLGCKVNRKKIGVYFKEEGKV